MISVFMRAELTEESKVSLKTVRGRQVCPKRQNTLKISRKGEMALEARVRPAALRGNRGLGVWKEWAFIWWSQSHF